MVWRLGLERAWVKINDRLFPMESLSSTILTLKCFFIQYCTVYNLMTICFFNGVYLIVIFYLKIFAKKTYFGCFHFFSARHMLPKLIIINQNESAFSTGKLCFLWKWRKKGCTISFSGSAADRGKQDRLDVVFR